MPPRLHSRHQFCKGIREAYAPDTLLLTDRQPFGYQDFPDNREHVIADGDTLHNVAARYFAPIPRAAGLWWLVADFQPEPIHDPTIKLASGSTLVIPSARVVLEVIFSASRRSEI